MSYNVNLIGAKGGDTGNTFKSVPDTLRSNDSFEMLVGLGSGRWKGLVNGLKSLKVNGVPLENDDGSTNFTDFAVFFADGDPAQVQRVNFKLGGGGGTTTVNTTIGNSNTGSPGPFVNAAVTTPGADFIDLRFVINSLYYQDSKGIRPNTMTLEVNMRPSGASTWINPLSSNAAPTYNPAGITVSDGYSGSIQALFPSTAWNGTNTWNDPNPGYIVINDKTTSAAVKELRISVPNTGNYTNKTWEVRVRLIEKDLIQGDNSYEERRSVTFESVAAITKQSFGTADAWRGLAWMQVVGKATDQLSGVPELEGIFDTKIVKVPPTSVFNPDTRAYTGATWDGSYVLSYTRDPAWCLKDLIEDPISGIAALSPGATLDKWDALDASKYFSQLVADGKGGYHPRFSFNVKIDQQQNAEETIQYMAGAVNALAVDTGDGKWRMKVDKPETPVAVFTRDNIVGEFTYQHTDIDTRFNDYTVTFLNADIDYAEDRARVFDQTHIDRFGRKPTTIVAVGADNRQEALRRAMFRLRTSTNESKIVNFTTNRQGAMVTPLSIILVADTDLGYVGTPTASDNRTTTRLTSTSGTTLTLGSSIRLEVGVTYQIAVTVPNANYNPDATTQPSSGDWTKPTITITRNVTNTSGQRGDVSILYIDSALPSDTPVNAPIALSAVGLPSLPVQYRVMEVTQQDEELISISALIIDTGKYAAADGVSESAITGQVSDTTIDAPSVPTAGMFTMKYFTTDYQTKRVLTVTWERPPSLFLAGFKVEYNLNSGQWITLQDSTPSTYVEIQQPENGVYNFRITAIDRRGRMSEPLKGSYEVLDTAQDNPPVTRRGVIAARPASGGRVGDRYTATDLTPIVTYVWTGSAWVLDSSFVNNSNQLTDGAGWSQTATWTGVTGAGKDALLLEVSNLSSDSVLSHGSEKQKAIIDWQSIYDDWLTILARFDAMQRPVNLQPYIDNVTTYCNALASYLPSLTPTWNDIGTDTPIVSATWINNWSAALNAISAAVAAIGGYNSSEDYYDSMSYPDVAAFVRGSGFVSGTTRTSIVNSNDTGGKAIQFGTNTDHGDFVEWHGPKYMAYSPEDLYEVSFDVDVQAAGSSTILYLGIQAVDRNYNNLGESYNYVAASAVNMSTNLGRRTYRAYMRGTAAVGSGSPGSTSDSPVPLPDGSVAGFGAGGTVYIRPMALFNYPNSTGSAYAGRTVLHAVSLRKVSDATVTWTGAWSSSRSYFKDEGVTYQGRSFASKASGNLNHTPPTTATSNTYWFLISDKGADTVSISLEATSPTFKFDKNDSPITFTNVFKATRQNSVASTFWYILDKDNVLLASGNATTIAGTGYFTRIDDDTLSMSQSQFVSFIAGIPAREKFTVVAELNGTGIDARTGVSKLKDGADGAPAVSISLTATSNQVKYDGTDTFVAGQTITINSVRQNSTTTPVFSIYDNSGTLIDAKTAANWAAGSPTFYSTTGVDNLTLSTLALSAIITTYGNFSIEAAVGSVKARVSVAKVKDGATGATGPSGGSLGFGVLATGTTTLMLATSGSTEVTDVSSSVTVPAGAKYRITLGGTNSSRSAGGSIVIANISIAAGSDSLFSGLLTIQADGSINTDNLTNAASTIITASGSGSLTFSITHHRSGPTGNSGQFDLNYTLEALQ